MIRRVVGLIHLWVGIVLCIPLVVLGLTGSVLVFEDELRSTSSRREHPSGISHSASEIIAAGQRPTAPGFVPASYIVSGPDGRPLVRLVPSARDAPPSSAVRVAVDPVSLEAEIDRQQDLLRQIFFLHSTLLLKDRTGRELVGWLGVVMLILGISGLVNWWPRRGVTRAVFGVRRDARGLLLQRELHGTAGIWGLLVFLTVSFSGVYLAFPETIRSGVDLVLPARDMRAQISAIRVTPIAGAEPLHIDDAVRLAEAHLPSAQTTAVFLPSRPDRPFRIAMRQAGQEHGAPLISVIVDPWTRRVVETFDPSNYSLGERILVWQHALHSGAGLGWGWKILVFLSGFLSSLFAISGVWIWQLKRRRRRDSTEVDAERANAAGSAAE